MILDLIADQRRRALLDRLLHQRDREIRHADVPGHAELAHMGERIQRLRQRHARVRPVQQQKIDLGQAQPGQALLGRAFEVVRGEMIGPDFCGDEHLVARHAGGAQPLADLALVLVDLRGVEVAIAEPQRLLDQPRADASAQLPGAEPDRGNL